MRVVGLGLERGCTVVLELSEGAIVLRAEILSQSSNGMEEILCKCLLLYFLLVRGRVSNRQVAIRSHTILRRFSTLGSR